MELDVNSGILIKPGVLILQVLIELYRQGYPPNLDTRECLLALVPTIRNSHWQEAYTIGEKLRLSAICQAYCYNSYCFLKSLPSLGFDYFYLMATGGEFLRL